MTTEPAAVSAPPEFQAVYARWFHDVCRWARACGAPDGEIEDVAQDVFVTVHRRLPDFQDRNLAAWLYTITARATRDHRRRAWLRRVMRPRKDVDLDTFSLAAAGPAEHLERVEDRRLLARLLEGMSMKKRAVVVLYELEEMTGEEIAALEGVPVDTVWSRLHHARREMREKLARMRLRGEI